MEQIELTEAQVEAMGKTGRGAVASLRKSRQLAKALANVEYLEEKLEQVRALPDRLLTVDDAAKVLRFSTKTVRKLAKDGEIAYHPLGDGPKAPLRFRKHDIEDFLSRWRIKAR